MSPVPIPRPDRSLPEFDRVWVRLENALAPIRTRIYQAQERMARQPQRPEPSADLLARAAEAPQAPPDLRAVADAVSQGHTTWAKVAAGEADDLPELARFYAASLARSRRLIEQSRRPDEPGRKEDGDG